VGGDASVMIHGSCCASRVHGDRDAGRNHRIVGQVPSAVTVEQAQESARSTLLAILSALKRTVGDLDPFVWLTLTGYVNADPGFAYTTLVLNPASELMVSGHVARCRQRFWSRGCGCLD
jgi:hypothetical protein